MQGVIARGLAVGLSLACASAVFAGAQVQLVPTPAGPYTIGQVVNVEVKLLQSPAGAGAIPLRFIQFDVGASSPELGLTLPVTHPTPTPQVKFWDFSSTSVCIAGAGNCGINHFIDADLTAAIPPGPDVLSITYLGLTQTAGEQIGLPAAVPVTVGKLAVTMPNTCGTFTLDLVNALDQDLNFGARIDYGFNPRTTWRASGGQITGGTLAMVVSGCGGDAQLLSSIPAFTGRGVATVPANGTLWRDQKNVLRFTFDRALPGVPTAGQLEIREMLAGNTSGPNLSASFAYALESGNTVLKISETTISFAHRKWFVIRNTGGWAGVASFEAEFPVQVGDSTGDNRVLAADVLNVNTGVSCVSGCGDQNRKDVNGDGRVLAADVLLANTKVTSLPVTKPTGW